ncbi:Alpha/Beta hydrolase protein [Suillus ampliporus]|nr:Alpha/Beta hydrolase protein [Suillus ampliporus]
MSKERYSLWESPISAKHVAQDCPEGISGYANEAVFHNQGSGDTLMALCAMGAHMCRERLKGRWGIADVSDCIEAVNKFGGYTDITRTVIHGWSLGGYATLASISLPTSKASDKKFFASATSNYGISNLELLAEDTHKFEYRYTECLLGCEGTCDDVYHNRSPVNYPEHIKTPLLVFTFFKIINGIINTKSDFKGHVEADFFDGEQHGWRTSKTIEKAIEFEREWYEKHMLGPKE